MSARHPAMTQQAIRRRRGRAIRKARRIFGRAARYFIFLDEAIFRTGIIVQPFNVEMRRLGTAAISAWKPEEDPR